jgi:hypothetical protein
VRWLALALLAFVALALVGIACDSNGVPAQLVIHYDAGSDGGRVEAGAAEGAPEEDASPYLGGPCVDDAQCNDDIACTYDSCDKQVGRCLNVPDDSQCQDGNYCDGMELCVPMHGCEPGAVVSCDNGNECEIGKCVEATKSCQYSPRDVDQDGDPDARCFPHHDCNDLDPNVSSLHAEVCANGIDDNCNGLIDEIPCVSPVGCTCSGAVPVQGAGSYVLSTIGCNDTFATSCSVANPVGAQNVVAAITVPAGPPIDLDVWVSATTQVAVAIQGTCGNSTTELACGSGTVAATGASEARARAYGVAPGTYFAVVTTQQPVGGIELQVDFLPNTPPPTNVDCASAAPITPGTPIAVPVVEPLPTNEPTACTAATGELTYSFTLTQPQNVRVYASTSQGTGTPIIGVRAPHCTDAADELGCETAGQLGLLEENLQPGTYVVTLGASAPIDATLDVELSAATAPSPDQTCTAPPTIAPNGRISFDLSGNESAIKDGCFPQGPDAAYDLSLSAASDVLLIERFPQTESGGVSFDTPACDMASMLACDVENDGAPSAGPPPARVAKRNVPAGDYRVVVADELGLQGTVDALVRDTVAPTIIPSGGAASCSAAVDVSNGGYFTGDTSTVAQDFTSGCDSPSSPPGGEQAQVLSLTLANDQRVVLDMEGSSYQTLLDVRQGPACPGSPTTNGCYVGFSSQRSFLDMELTAGPYFILVSGFDGAKGPWALDVRILPP